MWAKRFILDVTDGLFIYRFCQKPIHKYYLENMKEHLSAPCRSVSPDSRRGQIHTAALWVSERHFLDSNGRTGCSQFHGSCIRFRWKRYSHRKDLCENEREKAVVSGCRRSYGSRCASFFRSVAQSPDSSWRPHFAVSIYLHNLPLCKYPCKYIEFLHSIFII